jgi:hypothetical protein
MDQVVRTSARPASASVDMAASFARDAGGWAADIGKCG